MSDENGTAVVPEDGAPKSLVTKLAAIMAAVQRIAKRGRNDFHGYDYATEADIAEAIRMELATRHIMLIPSADSCERVSVGDKGSVLTTLGMTFTFLDGETGEEIKRHWFGAGTDKEDKGLYKAYTGGEKYFLLKTFLLPTGDDPEREEGSGKRAYARGGRREATAEERQEVIEHAPYAEREATKTDALQPMLGWQALMALRAGLPEGCQAAVPTDETMHAIPPTEATDDVPFLVDAIVRKAKERKISPKEWGDIMERFFGSRTARLLNNQHKPVAKLNPFFVKALYIDMDIVAAK